jgi:AAA family ATP:ADP antiporter
VRPVREHLGLEGGIENLPYLYLATLGSTLATNPLFAWIVSRYPRRRFIPIAYRFFEVNLLAFFFLLREGGLVDPIVVGRVFYVWMSVFNLFVVTVFWGFMADVWREPQGKRLFGFVGLGGTLGAVFGSSIAAGLAGVVGPSGLLFVAIGFLETAILCVRRLDAACGGKGGSIAVDVETDRDPRGAFAGAREREDLPASPGVGAATVPLESLPAVGSDDPSRGGIFGGIRLALSSSYLLGIAAYYLAFTAGSTFLYFSQARLVRDAVTGAESRTALFAGIDLAANGATLLVQLFLTGRVLRRFGVGPTLAVLPVLSTAGFACLGLWPGLATLTAFQTLRRATDFSLARPAREVLYTVVGREAKYKAKHFVDTFVYRAGDALAAWAQRGIEGFGVGVAGLAWIAAPISAAWIVLALSLGRRQAALARASAEAAPFRSAGVATRSGA